MDKYLNKETAIVAGASVLLGMTLTKIFSRHKKIAEEHETTSGSLDNEDFTSEEYCKIRDEQLVRNIQFFGKENQDRVLESFVIIVGLGGVGSHVFAAMVRSGVKRIRIVDFDRITLSSLNRHAFATREHVGKSKVQCAQEFAKQIFPHVVVESFEEFLSSKNLVKLLADSPDFVIDCIDNIDAKTDLVTYCVRQNIPIIAACGAGMKADPTRLQIRDISESKDDDLARALRVKLKKNKIEHGVPVVYSTEKTERELLPLKGHQEEDPDNFRIVANYRVRIVPVLGTMPALVAYAISAYVLCQIAKQPFKPHPIDDVKYTNYVRLNQILTNTEKKRGVKEEDLEFDMADIMFITREVFGWCCMITQKKKNAMEIVRWNPEKPASIENMVLINQKDANAHKELKTYEDVKNHYTAEVLERYATKLPMIKKQAQTNGVVLRG